MNTEAIAIKERINELRAKQRKFSIWEAQKAQEIQHLIRSQSQLEDDIIILEYELEASR